MQQVTEMQRDFKVWTIEELRGDLNRDLADAACIIAQWACETPDILEVALFGSRVKGTNSPDSDLDIAYIASADFAKHTVPIQSEKRWVNELKSLGVRYKMHIRNYGDLLKTGRNVNDEIRRYGRCIYRQL